MIVDSDFRKGDSVTIEVSNKPYVDRTIPPHANDYRNADSVEIKVFDPCGEMFINCPMHSCSDRIGWYLFRIQTNDEFPVGLYKVEVYVHNIVTEQYGSCEVTTPETTGTSGTDATTTGTTGTSGDGEVPSYVATNVSVKYFRLLDREVY